MDQGKHSHQNELSYYEQGRGSIPVIPYMEQIDLHPQPGGSGDLHRVTFVCFALIKAVNHIIPYFFGYV